MIKYDYILSGKKEFYPNLNNKEYFILLVDDEKKANFMCNIFDEFTNGCIGIDLEFKSVSKEKKEIALFQINLENEKRESFIFVLYPPNLSETNFNKFIKLLTNKKIIKVLHGGESLDIPYLYNNLFKNDKKLIRNFSRNLYDTKYLCEFSKFTKCSIYNLLLEYQIITQLKFDYLNSIEDVIGPIYTVTFDINNMNPKLIEYAFYDVIYLPTLLNKFIKLPYTKIISNLSSIIFYYKRKLDDKFSKIEEIVNKCNNFFINDNNEKYKLIDLYYFYLYYEINNKLINKLLEITYFKHFLEIILKFVIYKFIMNKYTVYIKTNEKLNKDILFSGFDINKLLLNKKKIINLFVFNLIKY
jgi:hypothetical protein